MPSRRSDLSATAPATAAGTSSATASVVGAGLVDAQAALNAPNPIPGNRKLKPANNFARNVLSLLEGQPLTWIDPNYQGINWSNINWDNITWDNIMWDNITW